MMKITLPLVIATSILAGCASKPDYYDTGDVFFETKINQDGTKLFAFSVGMDNGGKEKGAKGKGQERGQRPPPGGKERGERSNAGNDRLEQQMDEFYQLLDQKLAETEYCHSGYIEIDTHETQGRFHLLGECQESASQSDIEKFPNAY